MRNGIAALSLGFVVGCTPGGIPPGEEGSANVTIEGLGDAPLELVHDPLQSQLSLTPPAEGVVELTFTYQDPAVELRLLVDDASVDEGDVVALPADGVELTVDADGVLYQATAGSVEVLLFVVDEASAQLAATIDATLASDDAEITVVGDVEASSG